MKRCINIYCLAIIVSRVQQQITRARNETNLIPQCLYWRRPVKHVFQFRDLNHAQFKTWKSGLFGKKKCKQVINFLLLIIDCAATMYCLQVSTHLGGSSKYNKVFKMETNINFLREQEWQLIIIPDRHNQFTISWHLEETKETKEVFARAPPPKLALLRWFPIS